MDVEEIKGKVATAISYAKQIDDKAREQIARMCDYDFTKGSKIRIMPDVHAGKGCTIGTTMTVTANGYAKLSYKTAYLKAHYPAQYMCALLNSRSDQKKILPYIEECKRMGIELLPPDLSRGNRRFVVEGDAIRVGLCYIKGVGANLNLTDARDWQRGLAANNKLINEGALDYLGKERGWLLANLVSARECADRKAHCEERIAYYMAQCHASVDEKGRNKAVRMVEQWRGKPMQNSRSLLRSSTTASQGKLRYCPLHLHLCRRY